MSDRCIKRKYLNCKPKTCARNMHYIKSITELFSLHCTPLLISLKETYKCRAEWFFSGLAQVDSSHSAHINFHSHVLLIMGLCKQGLVGQEIIIILLLYTCILLVVHFSSPHLDCFIFSLIHMSFWEQKNLESILQT